MACELSPLSEHTGIEARGVDLSKPLDAETKAQLNKAFVEHSVLVIRDQHFTAKQYEQAASLFGELMEDQNRMYLADGVPLVPLTASGAQRRSWA